jgi:quinol monooxygenase YgiN
MPVVVDARIHGLAGSREQLALALAALAVGARREDGCLDFVAAGSVEDADEFVVISRWRDEAALRAHYAGAPYGAYTRAVSELLARPSDVILETVNATVHPTADPSFDPMRQG